MTLTWSVPWSKCVQENFRLCCTQLWQQLNIWLQRLAIQDNQRYSAQLLQKKVLNGRLEIFISRAKKLKGWHQLLRMFRLPHPSKFSSLEGTLPQTQTPKRCLSAVWISYVTAFARTHTCRSKRESDFHSYNISRPGITRFLASSSFSKATSLGESGSWGLSDLRGETMDSASGQEGWEDSCGEGQYQIRKQTRTSRHVGTLWQVGAFYELRFDSCSICIELHNFYPVALIQCNVNVPEEGNFGEEYTNGLTMSKDLLSKLF